MQQWKVLNAKEIRNIRRMLAGQWGFEEPLSYAFLQTDKDKLFIITRDIENLDLSKLRINTIGLYFGELRHEELRLSIEGSQLIGPNCHKNVVMLNDDEIKQWLMGKNIEKDVQASGFALISHGTDFFGTGRIKDKKILSYFPKERWVKEVNAE